VALVAWEGITDLAAQAAANPGTGRFASPFFAALHDALVHEAGVERRSGDKQGLVTCIKAGMAAAVEVLVADHPAIRPCSYRIEVPGLPRGKCPDYAFTNGKREYLIEQKSVLRFNEFSQVFLEALLAHRKGGDGIRFAALFNYLHQKRQAFEQLCEFEGRRLIHRICVLIPDHSYTAYSPAEIEGLFQDIAEWLG
jgi:hypothetical protein